MRFKGASLPALLACLLCGCAPHIDLVPPGVTRPPNLHEVFYTKVAADFHDARMCQKIYRYAIDERAPGLSGRYWSVDYQKSACYFYLALATRNPRLCKSVKTISVLPSNQTTITPTACLANLQNKGLNRTYTLSPPSIYYGLGTILKEMGYSAEDRYAAQYRRSPFINPVFNFYSSVRKTALFKAKLEAMPNYDEPFSEAKLRPANADEMLMQIGAVDDEMPALCRKISPNAYFGFRSPLLAWRSSVRDRCFYSVAADSNSLALCDKLSGRGATSITQPGVDRQGCTVEVKAQLSPNFHGRPHYGPVYFPTMQDFVSGLQKMGYEKPLVIDANAFGWSDFYSYLVFESTPAEKQEFVERAEALPAFEK